MWVGKSYWTWTHAHVWLNDGRYGWNVIDKQTEKERKLVVLFFYIKTFKLQINKVKINDFI